MPCGSSDPEAAALDEAQRGAMAPSVERSDAGAPPETVVPYPCQDDCKLEWELPKVLHPIFGETTASYHDLAHLYVTLLKEVEMVRGEARDAGVMMRRALAQRDAALEAVAPAPPVAGSVSPAETAGHAGALTFAQLRAEVVPRCNEAFPPYPENALQSWSLTDWGTALAGEVGEALNIIKKIRRGDKALVDVRDALGKELADTVIYCDLLAARAGIDLGDAVAAKFNEVSERVGSPRRLSNRAPAPRLGEAPGSADRVEPEGGAQMDAESLRKAREVVERTEKRQGIKVWSSGDYVSLCRPILIEEIACALTPAASSTACRIYPECKGGVAHEFFGHGP